MSHTQNREESFVHLVYPIIWELEAIIKFLWVMDAGRIIDNRVLAAKVLHYRFVVILLQIDTIWIHNAEYWMALLRDHKA